MGLEVFSVQFWRQSYDSILASHQQLNQLLVDLDGPYYVHYKLMVKMCCKSHQLTTWNQALPRLIGSHQGQKQEVQIQEEGLQGLNTKEKKSTFVYLRYYEAISHFCCIDPTEPKQCYNTSSQVKHAVYGYSSVLGPFPDTYCTHRTCSPAKLGNATFHGLPAPFSLAFSFSSSLTKMLYTNIIPTTTCFVHTVAMKLLFRIMKIFLIGSLNYIYKTLFLTHLWFNSCSRICVGLICSWCVLCCSTPFHWLGFPWNYKQNGIQPNTPYQGV